MREEIELPGALRWLCRRRRGVRAAGLALVTAMPGRLGTVCEVRTLRFVLGTERALVALREIDPDFYGGSAHKWLCGPKEAGVLFINRRSQEKLWPSIYSAYPGASGVSKTFESFGQRDEPAIRALGESLQLQTKVGRRAIEDRGRELAQALMAGLRTLPGVKVWTHADAARSLAIVSLQPGSLDPHKLALALYEKDRIVCATRPGSDRGGIRLSPHFYNSHAEVERTVAALHRYLTTGL